MGRKSTYKPKYAKQLIEGMRRDCRMSIDKCCQEWGVTRNAYYGWLDQHPKFKEASEIGERDFMVAFHDLMVDNAAGRDTDGNSVKGNAGVLTLMAKNILKWSDKVEIENTGPEQINHITFEVLQDRHASSNLIEHDDIEDADYDE